MAMKKQTVDNAIAFLMRCELKGGEVPAFNDVMQELHQVRDYVSTEDHEIDRRTGDSGQPQRETTSN